MSTVYVMSVNGKRLMPTNRCGHVRHLLKNGKAKIVSRHPFTIQLLYESGEHTQPLEIGVDSGYIHVGVSVKSERKEFFSAQFDLLTKRTDTTTAASIAVPAGTACATANADSIRIQNLKSE